MNKEKQIEEMAKDIALIIPENVDLSPRQYLSREFSEKYNGMGIDIKLDAIVTKLFAKGYRKASEVAREIFAEIETYMFYHENIPNTIYKTIDFNLFNAIKKKYTEEGK